MSVLPGGCPIVTELSEPAPYRAHTRIDLSLNWVREVKGNILEEELGQVVETNQVAALEISASGGLVRASSRRLTRHPPEADPLLAKLLGFQGPADELDRAFASFALYGFLPKPFREEVESQLGAVASEADFARLRERLHPLRQLRNRILDAAVKALATRCLATTAIPSRSIVELHLPVLDKKRWSQRFAVLAGCTVSIDRSGSVIAHLSAAESDTIRQNTTLAVVSSLGSSRHRTPSSCRLTFSDERVLDSRQLPLALAPVLEHYGFTGIPDRIPSAERVRVTITAAVSASAAECWRKSPRERCLDHYAAFAQVSRQSQLCLRTWLPYIHFSDPKRFATRESAYATLVYASSRPFYRRGRPEFSYDVMNLASVSRACTSVLPSLRSRLAPIRRYLAGNSQPETTGYYLPELAPRIVDAARRSNRYFQNLLVADRLAMERFTRLGNQCRRYRTSSSHNRKPIRYVLREAAGIDKGFLSRFRRLSSTEDVSPLGSLLLVEATAALSGHYGRPEPIEVTLRLSDGAAPPGAGALVVRHSCMPVASEPI